jgi:hypothetical protein
MQHSIALIEPAGLRIHQILQVTAGNGTKPVLDEV